MDLLGVARHRQDDLDIASKPRESLGSGYGLSLSCQSCTNPACQTGTHGGILQVLAFTAHKAEITSLTSRTYIGVNVHSSRPQTLDRELVAGAPRNIHHLTMIVAISHSPPQTKMWRAPEQRNLGMAVIKSLEV
ncbi:hypothetical protein CEK27_011188 [Fusarium fujikuroi]|uniref:Uncharacterized protein n=1 Tax=Fusarium fujikuroi TaxID=5127 RepID=A0A9Q9UFV6_FUSFU|nr:hypothetical protein CEK27_011188 [Fusarium fujikuroi]QGI84453.1 hypothetical protein CEK25_011182 [Fusarium fujikuroi]VTT62315.1 unnamed protein product [Fusarium fujikuroi]VTT80795.1 unnamed protein product [Fusarium fujikuroi]